MNIKNRPTRSNRASLEKTEEAMTRLKTFTIAAVTLGVIAMALGTLNTGLATWRAGAFSGFPVVSCTNFTFTQSTGASIVAGTTVIHSCQGIGCGVIQISLPLAYMFYNPSFTTVWSP